jgi:hypothetical protein
MYILFIRHGISHANFLKETEPFYFGTLSLDSQLTENGMNDSRKICPHIVNNIINNTTQENNPKNVVPVIFSSILTRAIQTADQTIRGLKELDESSEFELILLPYIEEIPLSIMFPIDRQNHPRNIYSIIEETGIKLDVIGSINPYNKKGDPIIRTNIKKFYKIVVPEIIKKYETDENSVIVIVSHRKVIEQATGISLGNCGAVLQNLSNMKSELIYDGIRSAKY